MIKNYLKIAFRHLQQQKVLSFVNIAGLSIGLACFILFLLFAVNEFGFDRFHKNAANIYRGIEWTEGIPGREPGGHAFGGLPLGPAMKKDFADVENYVRILSFGEENFVQADGKISRNKITYADPQLFSMFSFKLILGSPDALKDPHNIVITKEKALQLFGKTDPIGQRIDIKKGLSMEPFVVAAVAQDVPANSSIQFSMVGSYGLVERSFAPIAGWQMQLGTETYIQLRSDSKLMSDTKRMAAFRHKYLPDEAAELTKSGSWNGKGPLPISFRLQPLRAVHTADNISGYAATIAPRYIWILVSIAAGILLIACINFTTLSIGRSAGRAKEIGVRKVMGGQRLQLVLQFLAESFILTVISAVLALVLVETLLPLFNQLSGVTISFSFSGFPELLWLLAVVIIVTALLSGIYPALVLSGFKPLEVLRNRIRLKGSNFFTKSLVTLQFVLSISLVVSTIIILQQTKYMQSKDLGFNKNNVVMVDAEGTDSRNIYPLFKQNIKSGTTIAGITASETGLGNGAGSIGDEYEFNGVKKYVTQYAVDAQYLSIMGMKLIAGRDFDPALSTDTAGSIIVNEAMLEELGLTTGNAIGQQLKATQLDPNYKPTIVSKTIIGVIKNFNFASLDKKVKPQLFYIPVFFNPNKFFVRLKPGYPSSALAQLKKTWTAVVPGFPFRYSFLDEDFNRFYKNETRWSNIIGWAGGICIALACLGLFGLSALASVNRTKEIGIRKVLGASVSSIVGLLSKDFLKLVIVSVVIASPLSWFFMNKWLMDYAYRIDINGWVFGITGILALSVAFITVSAQSIKTAVENPVKSLRTE